VGTCFCGTARYVDVSRSSSERPQTRSDTAQRPRRFRNVRKHAPIQLNSPRRLRNVRKHAPIQLNALEDFGTSANTLRYSSTPHKISERPQTRSDTAQRPKKTSESPQTRSDTAQRPRRLLHACIISVDFFVQNFSAYLQTFGIHGSIRVGGGG